jgi:hypothetical protein
VKAFLKLPGRSLILKAAISVAVVVRTFMLLEDLNLSENSGTFNADAPYSEKGEPT